MYISLIFLPYIPVTAATPPYTCAKLSEASCGRAEVPWATQIQITSYPDLRFSLTLLLSCIPFSFIHFSCIHSCKYKKYSCEYSNTSPVFNLVSTSAVGVKNISFYIHVLMNGIVFDFLCS